MVEHLSAKNIELICIIVNLGQGSDVVQAAKRFGVTGGTVLLGNGTVNNRLLDYIGLSDIRKEIVLMVADKEVAVSALEKLNNQFSFQKSNHGVAFSTSVFATAGTKYLKCESSKSEERGVVRPMYHVINVIVDKGKAEDVIDAANKAGSKGGTIINARGSGTHETSKLFAMDIEPEREIVMILSEYEKTDYIVASIRDHLKMDDPGNGIIFIQDVNKTYGIYK
jgi:nitrogen regulatory protein PII